MKPNWSTYYRLGAAFQKHLAVYSALKEIGRVIGTTPQTAGGLPKLTI